MNIGQASAASGVSAKMIRYYESIGLLRPAARGANSYRVYGDRDVHELRFIRRSRSLGFSLESTGELLSLWRDRRRSSRMVKAIAQERLRDLEARIAELQGVASVLRNLVDACAGDNRPECPILHDLEPSSPAAAHCGKPEGGAADAAPGRLTSRFS